MRAILAIGTLGLLIWSAAALPQAWATPLNSWEHYCFTDENSDGRVCTTELRMLQDGEEFVFYFARGPAGPVPLVALGAEAPFIRMSVQVDEEEALTTQSCETGSCYFEVEASRILLRQFRKGRQAQIRILGEAERILYDGAITLIGFTAAYGRY